VRAFIPSCASAHLDGLGFLDFEWLPAPQRTREVAQVENKKLSRRSWMRSALHKLRMAEQVIDAENRRRSRRAGVQIMTDLHKTFEEEMLAKIEAWRVEDLRDTQRIIQGYLDAVKPA
jgi:hypothetical protein